MASFPGTTDPRGRNRTSEAESSTSNGRADQQGLYIGSPTRAYHLLIEADIKLADHHVVQGYVQEDTSLMTLATVQFMEKFVRSSEGLNSLCDILRCSKSVADQLHRGFELRIIKVPGLYREGFAREEAKKLLALLGIISIYLTQEPAMDIRFKRSGGLRHFLDGILSVKECMTPLDTIYLSNAILRLASRPGAHSPASEIGEVAKSSLIPALIECFTTCVVKWDSESTTAAFNVIEIFRTYCYFLKVLTPLLSARSEHQGIPTKQTLVQWGRC